MDSSRNDKHINDQFPCMSANMCWNVLARQILIHKWISLKYACTDIPTSQNLAPIRNNIPHFTSYFICYDIKHLHDVTTGLTMPSLPRCHRTSKGHFYLLVYVLITLYEQAGHCFLCRSTERLWLETTAFFDAAQYLQCIYIWPAIMRNPSD